MNLFNVYPLFNINPVKAQGSFLWDENGQQYLDFYGGHAVISIGHNHPLYVEKLKNQLEKISFYSNSVENKIQEELADKLGKLSGYEDYSLFLCNSGAEANENALKLASFHNGKKKIIYFSESFHGRTSAAVAVTDNPKIVAPVNESDNFIKCEFNNSEELKKIFAENQNEISAVIVEGIQGVGGINLLEEKFIKTIENLCQENNSVLILDEVQSGYARSGKFFAHQEFDIRPDLITVAKGMGNGFPMGGVLISPKFNASYGLLGTTFGGNHLACVAGLAVLEVIENEKLIQNAEKIGKYIEEKVKNFPHIKNIKRRGLMMGIELDQPCADVRKGLLFEHFIFTGNANDKSVLRILPALNITEKESDLFINALEKTLKAIDEKTKILETEK